MSSSVDSSSAYSSTNRITGLFSDLDTDTLVKSMCSGQQSKIDKQEQKLQTYQWQTDAMNDVVDAVEEFSNTYCSVLGNASMLKSSAYYSYSVSTNSSSSAVTLTSSSAALLGDYSVKVRQLAVNAGAASTGRVSADGVEISAGNTTALGDLSFANALAFADDGTLSFEINGSTFKFSKDTTLQNMINTINTDENANVTMKYSRLTDSFTLTADSGGADSSVTIKNIAGNAFGENSAFMIGAGTYTDGAQDAVAEINGVTVTRDTNEYTIDGITFQLNNVTEGTDEETIDFTVKRDYSATVDAISDFVESLNTLITKLDDLVSEDDGSYDYPPLTEAQKEEMSDEEIEKWEEKAKTGILHNDSAIQKLISNLKNAFYSAAGGTGKNAMSMGFSSGGYYDANRGLIAIDTDALTQALEKDPETIISMFTGGGSTAADSQQGIVYKIKSAMSTYLNTAEDSLENTADKSDNIETVIDKLEGKLDDLAQGYYDRFSAMETALATLNSQASYISQLFSS